jgi:Fic family protein
MEVNIFPDSREASPIADDQAPASEPAEATSEPSEDFDASFNAIFEEMDRVQGVSQGARLHSYSITILIMSDTVILISSSGTENFDNDDIDMLINELEEEQNVAAPIQEVQEMADDEEMWAIVRELEEQEKESGKNIPPVTIVPQLQEDSDDDLYVND